MIDPAWRPWYRSQHDDHCIQSGNKFEQYVTDALTRFHADFINPDPMGRNGDGGCDGIADNGSILYACYGADLLRGIDTPGTSKDRRTADKLTRDLHRALNQWEDFTTWRFVTNASIGPHTTKQFITLKREHGPDSTRPVKLEIWNGPDILWDRVVKHLAPEDLDSLIPGVPRAEDVRLNELVDLLDKLIEGAPNPSTIQTQIRPVPNSKMDYNSIPPKNREEFNEGRIQAAKIDKWFANQSSPDLRDTGARRFREIYEQAKRSADTPSAIVEAVYIALGGDAFRLHPERANAVYAITSYFFDSCDIFEEPPAVLAPKGTHRATTN